MKIKFLICLFLPLLLMSLQSKPTETEAIKKLLETEAATWRSGDSKAHAACWHLKPYSRILVSTPDGATYDVPPINMTQPIPNPTGGYAVGSNFKMNIQGKTAWVSHDEESTAKDGSKSYSYEIRLLEKIKGQWKLVGQSIHLYKKG